MARTADDFEKALAKVNRELKVGCTRVQVERRGDRLSLVAYLPNKAGIDKRSRRISPGLSANLVGLKEIQRLALRLSGDLSTGRFNWSDWVEVAEVKPIEEKNCSELIEEYRVYLECAGTLKGNKDERDRSWKKNFWNPALKWLPMDRPLNESGLTVAALHHDAVNSHGIPTRSRLHACIRLGQFAKWAGVEVDLKKYKGKYSPQQIERNIPKDDDIEAGVLSLTNPEWRWAAGMMATFGLRNHECWFATLSQDSTGWIVAISEGKTGARTARPLHPHWVELFDLPNGKPPDLTVRGHDEYGERMARHFKRSGIGFRPYDLRHAYAIRGSVVYKIPVAVMAAYCGHDPSVHWSTYTRHLTEATSAKAYQESVTGFQL